MNKELVKSIVREVLESRTDIIYIPDLDEPIVDSLIASGILIPPCKIGDTFYGIMHDCSFKYTVRAIVINNTGIWFETSYEMRFLYGSDAFLTEEEAQAKINGW